MSARLDTIERLEKIICDALIYSPLIPTAVNILNVGEAEERDSIINNTNNIIVRYAGSSTRQIKKFPPTYDLTMRFELFFSCQSYLSQSAHSFSTYLLTAAKSTLLSLTPSIEGLKVENPLYCVSEDPRGLSEESQFFYVQTYELEAQEMIPTVSLDPCVSKGDCRYLFPSKNNSTRLPLGGVLERETGKIYVPAYTGSTPNADIPENSGIRWSNEEELSGNWVFRTDPSTIFLVDPTNSPVYLVSTESYTPDGLLSVAIKDAETDETISEVFYVDTGKKLARYALDLWNNSYAPKGGKTSFSPDAVKSSSTIGTFMYGEFAVVKGSFAPFYSNPLNPEAKRTTLEGGSLIGVQMDTYLNTGTGRYYMVPQSPQGRGWVKEGSFELVEVNSLWKVGCAGC
jgi:hypothetical protein